MTRRPVVTGPRGWGLIAMAAYAAVRGVAYLPGAAPERLPRGLELISTVVPIWVYAALWLTVALMCTAAATGRASAAAVAALVGMTLLWGSAYLVGWVEELLRGDSSRAYLNAASYLGPALWTAAWSRLVNPPPLRAVTEAPA